MSLKPITVENSSIDSEAEARLEEIELQRERYIEFYNQLNPQESEIIGMQTLDYFLEQGAIALYDKYLEEKLPNYGANITVINEAFLIGQIMQPKDEGETIEDLQNYWCDEREPQALHLDNRATNSVGIDIKQIIIEESDSDDKKSNYSRLSKYSYRSSKSSIVKSRVNLGKTNKSLVELPTNQKNKRHTDSQKIEFTKLPEKPPEKPDQDTIRLRQIREKKDYVKSIELEKQKKIMQDDAEFETKKKEAQKLLKNKKFTHDFNGKVIFVNNKKQDKEMLNNIITLDVKSKQFTETTKFALKADETGKNVKTVIFRQGDKIKDKETLQFENQPNLHLTFKVFYFFQIFFFLFSYKKRLILAQNLQLIKVQKKKEDFINLIIE
ncbi:hypothetical protein IMG5_005480 [Ichthyophthirius multifiliis]|uniref:Uncharacterized protein n=1 Tax=Ichthyophthirius multifiliis TaxID=5932 RepID=G0QJH5_ICHMU|nr:hypothetical protein IMG5_005480 [Ichthyophthirius multifiliis]EGR34626.1 hypothetical protein IMG5_005480 [Ichthyophthirius multifiliis]|eukprot:XP_004039930.1 hypothetical protein IMG5_005480 [Ichthyophthirius multifiliis]